MKMVATAKLKKIRDSLTSLKEYTQEIELLISRTLAQISTEEMKDISSLHLVKASHSGVNLIILNTSNKGLCGGINNYNIKALKARVEELERRKHEVIIYCIGKKGFDYCQNHYPHYLFNKTPVILEEKNGFALDSVKEEITGIMAERGVSSSSVIFSKFINTTSQKTTEDHLTPIHSHKIDNTQKSLDEYEFDASKVEIANMLIPEFLLCKILHAVFENSTSEQSTRMIAMDNATNNAAKAVKNLNLIYNRIRQANITREISEIVSGVESLK